MAPKPVDVVVIFGPTASGKSALALGLAEELDGEIINADSRQVYRHMPIVSACPAADDYARVRHHLYEFVAPDERFNAGRWAALARGAIDEVAGRGSVPIVVGGTGFYLRVLMEGMSEIPEVPAAVEAELAARPVAELYAALREADPALAAKLKPGDTQRILRGLGVYEVTGRPLSDWQVGGGGAEGYRFLKVAVKPDRAWLHKRLEQRWQEMLARGVMDEVRALKGMGYGPEDAALRGLGLPELFAHVEGRMALTAALEKALARDRQYVKRQYTWLNNSYGAGQVFDCAEVAPVLRWILAQGLAPARARA